MLVVTQTSMYILYGEFAKEILGGGAFIIVLVAGEGY